MYQIDLSAGNVAEALYELSEQADVPVLFPYEVAETRKAKPVRGEYTLKQALGLLLQGTGLTGGLSDKGVLTISEKKSEKNDKDRRGSMKSNKNVLAVVIGFFFTASGQAIAQDGPPADAGIEIEEVIVTAQRRSERAQDVPISITTLDSRELEKSQTNRLSGIAELTPGLRFDNQTAWAQPTIRGVGNAVVSSGVGSNVGIYVDGFYVPNPLAVDFDFTNIESIQVLKGPQGTLFGRNTTGGAILVNSSRPSPDTAGSLKTTIGNYNTRMVEGYATTGLGERAAVDIQGKFHSSDGYWDHIATGNDDEGDFENWSGRIGVSFDITDNVNLLAKYIHHDVDDSTSMAFNTALIDGEPGTILGIPDSLFTTTPGKISANTPFGLTTTSDAYQLTLEADLGFATLTSYSQYREDDSQILPDNDGTAVHVFDVEINVLDKAITQELVLASRDDARLQWTTGLFFFDYEDSFQPVRGSFSNSPWMTIAGSTTTSRSYAGFVDATYEVIDNLYLTGGVRYSKDKVVDAEIWDQGDYLSVPDYSDEQLTPRAVIRYRFANDSSLYFSYTQGYKAGLLGVGNPVPVERVDPEEIDAFELGYKYIGDLISLDLAAFYYDYKNLQVSVYPEGLSVIKNAANSTNRGLDGQVRFAVTPNLDVSAKASWLDAEYDEFPNSSRYIRCEDPAACGASTGLYIVETYDSGGQAMQRAPELTATLSASYVRDLGNGTWSLNGNLYYSSDFYFDQSEQFEEDAYTTLGLTTSWTPYSDRYTVSLYGKNITDEEYRSQISATSFGINAVWAPPATYGASVEFRF